MKTPQKKLQSVPLENLVIPVIPFFFFLYLLSLAGIMRSLLFAILILLLTSFLLYIRFKKNVLSQTKDYLTTICQTMFIGSSRIISTIREFLSKYPSIVALILFYMVVMLSVIMWGLPNTTHPFVYHMDEWHQMNSIRELYSKGTSNVAGAANGPVFQFYVSGLYLLPFVIAGLLHPLSITSSITQIQEQEKLFIVLRMQTLLFGILCMILISLITKRYFRIHPFIPSFFFTVNPLWLSLSNYFKYDIALIFWMLSSLFFIFKSLDSKSEKSFYIACILSGIAAATKISALPLLPLLIMVYVLFIKSHYKHLLYGMVLYGGTLVFLGFPDLLFLRGNYFEFFQSNLVSNPPLTANYILGMQYPLYLLVNQLPVTFGNVFVLSSFLGISYIIITLFRQRSMSLKISMHLVTLLIGLGWFYISLIPLRLFSSGNRSLVLLPFLAIISALLLDTIFIRKKNKSLYLFGVLVCFLTFQTIQSLAWVQLKWQKDPRVLSSNWIREHINKKDTIAVESVPIYQMIPDLLLKSFYEKQKGSSDLYTITVVDEHTNNFPMYIIITNADIIPHIKNTSEEKILKKITKDYLVEKEITPDFRYIHFFNDNLSFSIPNIVPMPTSIRILRKKGVEILNETKKT